MLAFLRRPLRSAGKVTFCFNFAQVKASDSGAFSWQEPQKSFTFLTGHSKAWFLNFFWVWKKYVHMYLFLNLQAFPRAINRKWANAWWYCHFEKVYSYTQEMTLVQDTHGGETIWVLMDWLCLEVCSFRWVDQALPQTHRCSFFLSFYSCCNCCCRHCFVVFVGIDFCWYWWIF